MKKLIASRIGAFYYDDGKVSPFEFDEKASHMINSYPSRINSASRIKYPMIRKSFLANKDKSLRGKDEFIRVSWQEAINIIHEEIIKAKGHIYAESYEWGGIGQVSWGRMCVQRLMRVLGGAIFEENDYSTGAALAMMPYVFSSKVVYERPTDLKAICNNAELVLFIGANPLVTNLISHDVPLHEHYKYYEILKNKNNIFIDVYANESSKFLNAKNIIINPNTDSALLISICTFLYENNLYNKEFIKKYCTGFDEFKDYFLGNNDGVKKDFAWASEICKIEQSVIKNLALQLANKKSILILGRSIQRQANGEFNYLAAISLAAMLGHIGKDGLGIEFNLISGCKGESVKNVKKIKDLNSIFPKITSNDIFIPTSRLQEALLNPNKAIKYKEEEIILPDIKLLINASSSFFTHQPNTNKSIKAYTKADCIICLEPFFTYDAKMSDIILPVALEGEREDIAISSNKEIIFALKKIKDDFYEAKSDFQICKMIAKSFNKSYEFCKNLDELDIVELIYDDLKNEYKKDNIYLPNFNEFYEKSFVKIPSLKEQESYTRFKDLKNINLANEKISKMGLNAYAHYKKADEFCNNYPYFLVSPHSKYRLHSQLDNSDIAFKINNKEPVYLNSKLAKKHKIKNNDIVKIFNHRGAVLCGVVIDESVKDNVLILHQGAWFMPDENGICQNGNANVLTSSKISSIISCSNIAHTCKVDLSLFKSAE